MKSTISSKLLTVSQHAYRKGKSTETALHSTVSCIERSFHRQEFTLIAFLDIEGAFNNVHPQAIMRGLQKLNIATHLGKLIHFMLTNRKVLSTLGSSTTGREVSRGTPQGGVICPFLWVTVVNDLLKLMASNGYNIIAYADDVIMQLYFKENTLRHCDLMENALTILSKWAENFGLDGNPAKTELVLFTRKHRIPELVLPELNGMKLKISENAKYLENYIGI